MTRSKTRLKRGKRRNEPDEEIRGFRSVRKNKKPAKKINLNDLYDEDSIFDSDEFYENMNHYNDDQ